MAELDDKEYSSLKDKLENFGDGALKHHTDTEQPLPPNILKARYTDAKDIVEADWEAAKDAQTLANKAFDKYHASFKTYDTMVNSDTKTIKGIYGIYSETLRDYGVKPEKKRTGRKAKPGPPAG